MALGVRLAALALVAAACSTPTDQVQPPPVGGGGGGGGGGAKTASTIKLSVVLARVGVDQSFQLAVTAQDSTGAVIQNPGVTYSSSDNGLATVTSTGLIHGVSLGAASVQVTAAGDTVIVPVVVATHPVGTLTGDLSGASSVNSRPFTVAISSRNAVYVGRQDLPYVQRTELPDTTFGDSVLVGNDPTDIAFNFSGTRAYITDQFSGSLGITRVGTGALSDSIGLPGQPYRVVLDLDGDV